MTIQKGQATRYSARDPTKLCIFPENSTEDLELRREHWWGYVSVYENIPEKLQHLPPNSCRNFT